MLSEDWLHYFMEIAHLISTRSKDPSTKVGAVIVDTDRRLLGSGYNGFPRHVVDDPVRYETKAVKCNMVVHAEANAILNAVDLRSLRGASLIATKSPCSECTKLIIQSGISTVYAPNPPIEGKWHDDAQFATQMMREAGVMRVATQEQVCMQIRIYDLRKIADEALTYWSVLDHKLKDEGRIAQLRATLEKNGDAL